MSRFCPEHRRCSRFLWLLLSAFPAIASCEQGPAFRTDDASPVLQARLLTVTDGDSLRVGLASGVVEIRLHGIDAPEVRPRRQRFGPEATKVLKSLVNGAVLEVEPVAQDRYDRVVARVYADGHEVNAAMLEKGYAWAYRQYLDADTRHYCDLEDAARRAGRGIWVGDRKTWQAPWEFRRAGEAGARYTDYSRETADSCRADIGQSAGRPAAPATPAPASDGPARCRIKGNINARGDRIYHVPGGSSYADTRIDEARGERWFCSEEEARKAGWRPPRK